MGFIGKLLSTVSSVVLIFAGASGASASKSPPSRSPQGAEQQLPSIGGGAGELLGGFIIDTGTRYTEDAVEAAIRRMLDGMSPDRVADLPNFVRGLRSLGLSPEVEVAAVETLISVLEELSGTLISAEQAAAVTGQVFDEFVEPLLVARGDNPRGKFEDEGDFPGQGWGQGQKKGQPFQPS